mgnify:CR=1 FL=1
MGQPARGVVVSAFVAGAASANVEATTQGPQADADERPNGTRSPMSRGFRSAAQKLAQRTPSSATTTHARRRTQPQVHPAIQPCGAHRLQAVCDCGQMIGSGEHVEQAGKRAFGHERISIR